MLKGSRPAGLVAARARGMKAVELQPRGRASRPRRAAPLGSASVRVEEAELSRTTAPRLSSAKAGMRCSKCHGNGEYRGPDGQTRRMCDRCGGTGKGDPFIEYGWLYVLGFFALVALALACLACALLACLDV